MERRRLLFICPVVPKLGGSGSQIRTASHLLCLAEHFDITLAIVTPAKDERDIVADVPANIRAACSAIVAAWAEPRVNRMRDRITNAQLWMAFRAIWLPPQLYSGTVAALDRLPDRLAGQHFDVVHCVQLRTARAIRILPRAGVTWDRLVIDVDNYESRTFSSYAKFIGIDGGFQYALLHRLEAMKWYATEAIYIRRFDDGYVCSSSDRRSLQRRFPRVRWTVVPNVGLQPTEIARVERPVFTFLFVGTLDYTPNEDAARFFCHDVLPHLQRLAAAPFRLIIAGRRPGPAVRELTRFANVEVVADPPSIAALYAESDVALAPIRFGGGSRIKILEAFSYGIPVVTTSFGVEGTEGVPGQHFLMGDDPESFAEQCQRLLDDGELRRRIGLAGQELYRSKYNPGVLPGIFQRVFDISPSHVESEVLARVAG